MEVIGLNPMDSEVSGPDEAPLLVGFVRTKGAEALLPPACEEPMSDVETKIQDPSSGFDVSMAFSKESWERIEQVLKDPELDPETIRLAFREAG